MKSLIVTAAAAAFAVAAPAVASAQGLSPVTPYASLGYAQSRQDGVDLGAVQARLGARAGQYVGVETELAAGVDDDRTWVAGAPVNVELKHQAAVYGVGFLPVKPNLDLYARVGYGQSKIKASVPGASASDTAESWNYGAGAQYFVTANDGLRADYTRHDFTHDGGEADVWSLGYVRKF